MAASASCAARIFFLHARASARVGFSARIPSTNARACEYLPASQNDFTCPRRIISGAGLTSTTEDDAAVWGTDCGGAISTGCEATGTAGADAGALGTALL